MSESSQNVAGYKSLHLVIAAIGLAVVVLGASANEIRLESDRFADQVERDAEQDRARDTLRSDTLRIINELRRDEEARAQSTSEAIRSLTRDIGDLEAQLLRETAGLSRQINDAGGDRWRLSDERDVWEEFKKLNPTIAVPNPRDIVKNRPDSP